MVLPLWVVENRLSPLLWLLAYTTACTTVQAVIMQLVGSMRIDQTEVKRNSLTLTHTKSYLFYVVRDLISLVAKL